MKKKELAALAVLIGLLTIVFIAGGNDADIIPGSSVEYAYAAVSTVTPTPTETPTPTPKLEYLSAMYLGGSVVVGEALDRDQIAVVGIWSDGTYEDIADFTIRSLYVKNEGENSFVVTYRGKVDTFYVTGKKLTDILAYPMRDYFHTGNGMDERDVGVMAYYSDGSTEDITTGFTFSPKVFNTAGTRDVTVTYSGKSYRFQVYVETAGTIRELTASYNGTLVEGETVDRNKLDVMAVYSDLSTERITQYGLTTTSFPETGPKEIRVNYKGLNTTAAVDVVAKKPVSMTVRYSGEPVVVGYTYNEDDMYVTVKFNNGIVERVRDYVVGSKTIWYVGENVLKIIYDTLDADVVVKGTAYQEPDFTYTSTFAIESMMGSYTVTTAIPKHLDTTCIKGKFIKLSRLEKIYRKLNTDGAYSGFSYHFANDDDEVNLPVTVRITLPYGFEPEYADLYFSTNLKSLVGRMNKTIIDDHTFETTLYRTGNYMLVYDPALYESEEGTSGSGSSGGKNEEEEEHWYD